MQDISLKPGCETMKHVIAFVVTGKRLNIVQDFRHYGLEVCLKCSNNLNHSHRALSLAISYHSWFPASKFFWLSLLKQSLYFTSTAVSSYSSFLPPYISIPTYFLLERILWVVNMCKCAQSRKCAWQADQWRVMPCFPVTQLLKDNKTLVWFYLVLCGYCPYPFLLMYNCIIANEIENGDIENHGNDLIWFEYIYIVTYRGEKGVSKKKLIEKTMFLQ